MTQLPRRRIVHATSDQKRTLIRWLHEWRIDGLLREDEEARTPQENHGSMVERGKISLLYDSKPVRAGQIRLFQPFFKETKNRPRYIAVLKENKDGYWLVAPFSRFSHPAVPGEWKTGRKIPILRILCIWNARWLAGALLDRSWVVDRMSLSKVDKALVLYQFLVEGKDLLQVAGNQIGPPLVHPLDPRIEYLEEERRWFSILSATYLSGAHMNRSSKTSPNEDRSLPLAAEEHGQYRLAKGRRGKRRPAGRNPFNK